MKKAIPLLIFVGFLLISSAGMSTTSEPCNKLLPELFKEVSAAVVFISAISIDPFRLNNRVNTAVGSGIIFSDEGLILTNSHIVFGRQPIFVILDDGRRYPVILLGADPIYDLAILKIPNAPNDAGMRAQQLGEHGLWLAVVEVGDVQDLVGLLDDRLRDAGVTVTERRHTVLAKKSRYSLPSASHTRQPCPRTSAMGARAYVANR